MDALDQRTATEKLAARAAASAAPASAADRAEFAEHRRRIAAAQGGR